MKKFYVKPEIEEVILEFESILAGTTYEDGNTVPGINFDDDGE